MRNSGHRVKYVRRTTLSGSSCEIIYTAADAAYSDGERESEKVWGEDLPF